MPPPCDRSNPALDTAPRPCYTLPVTCVCSAPRGDHLADSITIAQAAQMLGIHRDTVLVLLRKGELKGHKKTLTRTSPFVVDRDSVLDFDRRRREASQPPAH